MLARIEDYFNTESRNESGDDASDHSADEGTYKTLPYSSWFFSRYLNSANGRFSIFRDFIFTNGPAKAQHCNG